MPSIETLARHMMRIAVAATLAFAMLVASPALADASGTFSSGRHTLDLDGAYAFWGRSAAPSGEAVIKVAVSNAGFTEGFFDDWYDRETAIDKIFVDDDAKVVYLEFEPGGKYHGLSYFFASGENCGYCYDSAVQSSVRMANGRLKGKLAFKRANARPAFDIDLDVAMPEKEHRDALPAGGGDPGRAYLAYHKALNANDKRAAYAVLSSKTKAFWDKFEKKGVNVVDAQLDQIHGNMASVSVTRGYVRGDRAVLLFDGSSKTIDHMHGEALMRRENGAWGVQDELVSVGAR
jgi:hypothetical protein